MSEKELELMWKRVEYLTRYTYPRIQDDFVIAPIINFRLGDIYNNKIGNISSLSYTFPDEGTWETDPEIGLLPKIVDVSLTIDFIEQLGSSENLYGLHTQPHTEFNEDSKTTKQSQPTEKPKAKITTLSGNDIDISSQPWG